MNQFIYSIDTIPNEMKLTPSWINWYKVPFSNDKIKKQPIPYLPEEDAFYKTLKTYSFEQIVQRAQITNTIGIGFVFNDTHPFIGIDIDNIMIPNAYSTHFEKEMYKIAENLIKQAKKDNCYIEKSISEKGIHIYGYSKKKIEYVKQYPKGYHHSLCAEVFYNKNYLTVTGNCIHNAWGCIDNTVAIANNNINKFKKIFKF